MRGVSNMGKSVHLLTLHCNVCSQAARRSEILMQGTHSGTCPEGLRGGAAPPAGACLLGVHALEGAVTLPIILRRLQSRQQLPVRDVCGIAA